MRVIAGEAKGRRLRSVRGLATRPTSDKVKGAIFNILESRFSLVGVRVLDLYAGSGGLGIEALSRGAQHATFVEASEAAVATIRENLRRCGFSDRARVLRGTVQRVLPRLVGERAEFDLVLADPPYESEELERLLSFVGAHQLVRAGGWLVAELPVNHPLAAAYGTLRLLHTWRYGKTAVALFQNSTMTHESTTSHSLLKAVYAGSFDPITNGHIDLIRRAIEVFDQVIVAVAGTTSDAKKGGALFTAEERVDMIREALRDAGERVRVDSFAGLLVDYCDQVGARVIIRGLRAVSDFEYEFQMAMMNRHLRPHIHTVFLPTSEAHSYTSSRLVKEVAALGGDISGQVPENVRRRLLEKLARSR
jgi:pantetheine-phosphate adenylyltransferase